MNTKTVEPQEIQEALSRLQSEVDQANEALQMKNVLALAASTMKFKGEVITAKDIQENPELKRNLINADIEAADDVYLMLVKNEGSTRYMIIVTSKGIVSGGIDQSFAEQVVREAILHGLRMNPDVYFVDTYQNADLPYDELVHAHGKGGCVRLNSKMVYRVVKPSVKHVKVDLFSEEGQKILSKVRSGDINVAAATGSTEKH